MPYPKFDRAKVRMLPLAQRKNKNIFTKLVVTPDATPHEISDVAQRVIAELAERVVRARKAGRPVMLAFGAHTIKNGLSPVLIKLINDGWVTHLATNGAGIIHDWEFALQGESCEDVAHYVSQGQFGNWQETGFNINLALNVGAYNGLGYGESLGSFIMNDGVEIPSQDQLLDEVKREVATNPARAAAAADLLAIVREFNLPAGKLAVEHRHKEYSVQAAAFAKKVPSTGHPMIGHDIIYNHAMNRCAFLGRAAERDFLTFADSVSRLTDGVYVSLGSAVMSPMVFEKSLSIAQNVAIQNGARIQNHFIVVADLAKSSWDWTNGEPPEDNPDYYLRYNKTFSRMGGTMRYVSIDNRDFLLHLVRMLTASGTAFHQEPVA